MPEIQMPKLSDTMTEGTLVSWKKKVGDEIAAGEVSRSRGLSQAIRDVVRRRNRRTLPARFFD